MDNLLCRKNKRENRNVKPDNKEGVFYTIDNAVKFTPGGGKVQFAIEADDKHRG